MRNKRVHHLSIAALFSIVACSVFSNINLPDTKTHYLENVAAFDCPEDWEFEGGENTASCGITYGEGPEDSDYKGVAFTISSQESYTFTGAFGGDSIDVFSISDVALERIMSFSGFVPKGPIEEMTIDNRSAFRAYFELDGVSGWLVLTSQNDYPGYPVLIMAMSLGIDFRIDENTFERILKSVRWE